MFPCMIFDEPSIQVYTMGVIFVHVWCTSTLDVVKRTRIVALHNQHKRLAEQQLSQLRDIAEKRSLSIEIREEEGDFVKRILHHVQEQSFELIFLTKDDRPFISRFLFGSHIDRAVQLIRKEGTTPILVKGDRGWN